MVIQIRGGLLCHQLLVVKARELPKTHERPQNTIRHFVSVSCQNEGSIKRPNWRHGWPPIFQQRQLFNIAARPFPWPVLAARVIEWCDTATLCTGCDGLAQSRRMCATSIVFTTRRDLRLLAHCVYRDGAPW